MNASDFVKRRQEERAAEPAYVPTVNAPDVVDIGFYSVRTVTRFKGTGAQLCANEYHPTGQYDATDHDAPDILQERERAASEVTRRAASEVTRRAGSYVAWLQERERAAEPARTRRLNRERERAAEWHEMNALAQLYRGRPWFLDWLTYDGRFYARYLAYQVIFSERADIKERTRRIIEARRIKRHARAGLRRMERNGRRKIKANARERERNARAAKRAAAKTAQQRKNAFRARQRLERLQNPKHAGRQLTYDLKPFIKECAGLSEADVRAAFLAYGYNPAHMDKALKMHAAFSGIKINESAMALGENVII